MNNLSDISQTIIETINSIFQHLFTSIDNNLYSLLDDITFINSNIIKNYGFEKILGTSTTNGILLISNSLLLGFIIYYSIRYLLSHIIYTKIETPFSFIIKLILFGIFMNFSFFITETFINIFYYITTAIIDLGELIFNKPVCFSELISIINSYISTETTSLNIFSLDGFIKGSISFSLLNLVFSYSIRYILVKVFVLLSPFAFLSLVLNNTSWFFKAWLKNFFSLLFIQIIISLILLILFSMDYNSSDLFTKLIYVGGLYSLIKVNSIVRDFIGGISTDVSQNVNKLLKFNK